MKKGYGQKFNKTTSVKVTFSQEKKVKLKISKDVLGYGDEPPIP
jgi:hypothetical protein